MRNRRALSTSVWQTHSLCAPGFERAGQAGGAQIVHVLGHKCSVLLIC